MNVDNAKGGMGADQPAVGVLVFTHSGRWAIGAILEKKGGENQGGQKTKKEENSQGRDLSNPALG